MSGAFGRICRRVLWRGLLPLSLLTGCRLYEPPIYPRLALAPNVRPLRVLFIGNSLTYYNDLSGLVQQLSMKEERPLEVDSVTVANATLAFHWTSSSARKRLQRSRWDFVVLQEYSTLAADNPEKMRADYLRFAGEVKGAGAQPIIFENWTHAGRPQDMPGMHQTYEEVQEETGGELAAIGTAWARGRKEHPEIKMFEDEKHPSVAGTYLTACVLYKTLYHKPATGLPLAIAGLKLSQEMARMLQHVADEVEK